MDSLNFNIQEWVDLNSYSDSKGWKGYCRRNKPFTLFRANKIVGNFVTFFRKYTNNVIIISNVFRNPQFRSVFPCEAILYVEMSFWGSICCYEVFRGFLGLA